QPRTPHPSPRTPTHSTPNPPPPNPQLLHPKPRHPTANPQPGSRRTRAAGGSSRASRVIRDWPQVPSRVVQASERNLADPKPSTLTPNSQPLTPKSQLPNRNKNPLQKKPKS
ncbi:hypothetical protein T484DRAFT_1619048, partial [Baffinella frigidus]